MSTPLRRPRNSRPRSSSFQRRTAGLIGAVGFCLGFASGLPAAVQTVADRYVLAENAPAIELRVLANDRNSSVDLANATLSVLRAPMLGQATVDNGGTPATASDDTIRYQPAANRSGEDNLRYRLCGGGRCAEGEVDLIIRPVTAGLALSVATSSGHRDITASGVRPMPSARFLSSPLVEGHVSEFPLAAGGSPATPFAGNGAVSLRMLPSAATAREWRVLVDARSLSSGNVDVYLGIDLNRDGRASVDELRCAAGMSTTAERCEMAVTVPDCGNLAYWTLVVNAGSAAHTARVETFEVPMDAGDGSLAATGPGVTTTDDFPLRIVWDAPQLADTQSRVGYVTVQSATGADVGSFPVRIDRAGRTEAGLALASGEERLLRLRGSASHDRLYIDVPAGATALEVRARASDGMQLYLARVPQPVGTAAAPVVGVAPARSQASAASSTTAATQFLSVRGAALAPGRWYVVPINGTSRMADVAVEASITATAPLVRPGGYFNTARSGHGLFLYPAGSEWAGLWYTYLQDGSSTWYYLQGPAPGANGQWKGRIFRSAWDGQRNVLTAVGEAVTTPNAADAFTFSFHLDGEQGSEPFNSFGRGCPSLAGSTLNVSSHWYDPTHSGTGYSVQMFEDYEFYAAFVYDAAGVPRFLTAERSGFGGSNATITLDQLTGFCPLCARTAAPTRRSVGTLARTFSGGRLDTLRLDGTYQAGVSGRWASVDRVEALGGAEALQGCAL